MLYIPPPISEVLIGRYIINWTCLQPQMRVLAQQRKIFRHLSCRQLSTFMHIWQYTYYMYIIFRRAEGKQNAFENAHSCQKSPSPYNLSGLLIKCPASTDYTGHIMMCEMYSQRIAEVSGLYMGPTLRNCASNKSGEGGGRLPRQFSIN